MHNLYPFRDALSQESDHMHIHETYLTQVENYFDTIVLNLLP
jgi:hypothetical protein